MIKCDGVELTEWDAKNFYSDAQIQAYVDDLVEGRRAFTEEIATQGMRKEIRELAHRELDAIAGKGKKAESWAPPPEAEKRDAAEDRLPLSPYITPWEQRRPERGLSSLFPAKKR